MKKLLAAALILLLLLPICGISEGEDAAAPSPVLEASMRLSLQGQELTLSFDSAPDYSFFDDTYLQACFFGYDSEGTLYEIFLIVPADAEAGSTITPEFSLQNQLPDAGVWLYITDYLGETALVATQSGGESYPLGSTYSIHFSDVAEHEGARVYTGSFSAALASVDQSIVSDVTGDFHFEMGEAFSAPFPGISEPQATIPPAPEKLTTPAKTYDV